MSHRFDMIDRLQLYRAAILIQCVVLLILNYVIVKQHRDIREVKAGMQKNRAMLELIERTQAEINAARASTNMLLVPGELMLTNFISMPDGTIYRLDPIKGWVPE